MPKKKICFLAQFPPPMHGLSKAVETLYDSKLKDEFEFEKVDLTNNKKFLRNFMNIWKSNADLFYFTISQTKSGNIRDLIIFKLLSFKKKKCLIHLHGGYYRKLVDEEMNSLQRKMNYEAISKLDGTIVLSKSLKPIFQGMISEDKIYVVPNCVDDVFFISDEEFEMKVASLKEKKVFHVLYLSNFIASKGYLEVLKIAKIIKEEMILSGVKKYHFNFAGNFFEERDRELFESYIIENDLEELITYHGVVGGEEKKELLKKCDIFILLTRYPKEGQPISILEAMGNGMVILTTNHAGIPDIVRSGVNGYISVNQDVIEIEDWLSKNSSIFPRIVEHNRFEVKEKYTEKVYIDKMKNIFRDYTH
ncbi:glycosyl transferase family 1 [Priestia megaterium]|uniref:glycosyltransferase family 4 protein n=1 Tax=Priestia megaterium TaxID=1404 RepID=UPI000BFA815A|nr:glycosyltransferase family 4 protein [Priestia megaterium]PFO15344.1 glycosyl transferase family 1 [Priestia megaterium]